MRAGGQVRPAQQHGLSSLRGECRTPLPQWLWPDRMPGVHRTELDIVKVGAWGASQQCQQPGRYRLARRHRAFGSEHDEAAAGARSGLPPRSSRPLDADECLPWPQDLHGDVVSGRLSGLLYGNSGSCGIAGDRHSVRCFPVAIGGDLQHGSRHHGCRARHDRPPRLLHDLMIPDGPMGAPRSSCRGGLGVVIGTTSWP